MGQRIALGPGTETSAIAGAAAALRAGGVALLPAEGVYGFHAMASSAAGVERLRAIKQRAEGKGFIGLVERVEDLDAWSAADSAARDLARKHWPGPLTLVVAASPATPESLRAPDGTVALRCPGSAFLRSVVRTAGGLLLSTSANAPGGPAARRVGDAPDVGADFVVDAGELPGAPSTIARVLAGRIEVLREGAVRLAGSDP
jgi:tRNA threonylcarbamoyl adenosine modification protein (Sua5/YciO/YrdC/YwlC family)